MMARQLLETSVRTLVSCPRLQQAEALPQRLENTN